MCTKFIMIIVIGNVYKPIKELEFTHEKYPWIVCEETRDIKTDRGA